MSTRAVSTAISRLAANGAALRIADVALNYAVTIGEHKTFSAQVVSFVIANNAWEYGSAESYRPVLAVFAGGLQEIRSMAANILLNGKLKLSGPWAHDSKGFPMEFMRSTQYTQALSTQGNAALLTVYQPALYDIEPVGAAANPDNPDLKFCVLPGAERLVAEAATFDNRSVVEHLQRAGFDKVPATMLYTFAALSALFCARISTRLDMPIIHDPRFYAQLLAAYLHYGLATLSNTYSRYSTYARDTTTWGATPSIRYYEFGVDLAGYAPGICVVTSKEEAGKVIASEIARFEKLVRGELVALPDLRDVMHGK